jgi:excisionase family DNA binding protein
MAAGVTGRLLTANEVAELLAVPVSWVRESTRSGAMRCVRLGRYVRFERPAVEAWMEECRCPGRPVVLRSDRPGRRSSG